MVRLGQEQVHLEARIRVLGCEVFFLGCARIRTPEDRLTQHDDCTKFGEYATGICWAIWFPCTRI